MRLSYENNPTEVINKLLEHHDIKTLQAIINSKARKKEPRGNDFFTIGTDVYIQKKMHDGCKLEWAIDQIAERQHIKSKTVKNHVVKFRKYMKDTLATLHEKENGEIDKNMDISQFIDEYMEIIILNSVNPYVNFHTYSYYQDMLNELKRNKGKAIPF